MKYATKRELIADIEAEYASLEAMLDGIPVSRHREPGVWGDDWTVHDLVAHLSAWHRMLLAWHRTGLAGGTPEMPAPGYKWNETPRLNRAIQAEHAGRPVEEVRAELAATHAEVMELVRRLSEEELLEPGLFDWTGKNAVVTYVGANTASHYRFAMKVLKRWLKASR